MLFSIHLIEPSLEGLFASDKEPQELLRFIFRQKMDFVNYTILGSIEGIRALLRLTYHASGR